MPTEAKIEVKSVKHVFNNDERSSIGADLTRGKSKPPGRARTYNLARPSSREMHSARRRMLTKLMAVHGTVRRVA